jgi:sterol 3beta-glucosyltransferase
VRASNGLKAGLIADASPHSFGSVPVLDPKAMTSLVLSAVKASGVRALISTGWGKLGDGLNVPPNVCLVGNVPHDWLFERVAAVVHHGGAGTTAIAVRSGKPSLVGEWMF